MKIYAAEKADGLEGSLAASSIAMSCRILPNTDSPTNLKMLLANASSNQNQSGLYYLNSVLVSTGWNKNDDVFDPSEVWAARNTPVDKQFNFMHDQNDIIGHITDSMVLVDGVKTDTQPEIFDVVTSAVIYTSWFNPDQKERITNLIKEIDDDQWSVSMECRFDDFDYAVITETGDHKVIVRDETSAFLTKHLRMYGGTGKYENHKIGRKLKNIIFSGKGLVDNPANPRSIILKKDAIPFNTKSELTVASFTTEKNMDLDTLKKENERLQAELTKVQAEVNSKASLESQAKIETLESNAASKDAEIVALTVQVAELNEAVVIANAERDTAKSTSAKLTQERRDEKRVATLVECGMAKADAVTRVEKFAHVDDEVFMGIVDILVDTAKKAALAATNPVVPNVTVDPEDVDADAAVIEDVLDTAVVDTKASLNGPADESDGRQEAIASATAWFSKSVLKSTKNINK